MPWLRQSSGILHFGHENCIRQMAKTITEISAGITNAPCFVRTPSTTETETASRKTPHAIRHFCRGVFSMPSKSFDADRSERFPEIYATLQDDRKWPGTSNPACLVPILPPVGTWWTAGSTASVYDRSSPHSRPRGATSIAAAFRRTRPVPVLRIGAKQPCPKRQQCAGRRELNRLRRFRLEHTVSIFTASEIRSKIRLCMNAVALCARGQRELVGVHISTAGLPGLPRDNRRLQGILRSTGSSSSHGFR